MIQQTMMKTVLLALTACAIVSQVHGWDADEEAARLQGLELDESEARSFLHGRNRRFLTSLNEECREGCYWEEVREVHGNHEKVREFMRSWKCSHTTKCASGYFCATPGTDYGHINRLTQACWRHGGWCSYGPWSGWSACSTTCNPGASERQATRVCSCPSQVGGGNPCSGSALSKQTQSCQLAKCNCGPLPTPTFGSQSGPGTMYQDVVSFTCATGYFISSGSGSRMCDANALWSGSQPVCSRKPCPSLKPNSNTTQNGASFLYQDAVSWTCDGGYERTTGDYSVQCQATQIWNGTQLQCTRVTCPTLSANKNSQQTGASFRYLDLVTWTCDPGYERDTGDGIVQCQQNRQWNGTALTCKRITCPTLSPSPNSTQTGSSFRYQDTISWKCDTGYEKNSGMASVNCMANRQWSGQKLTCKRITCPSLSPTSNVTQTGSSFRYLDHVSWACDIGYQRKSGDLGVQCQANRKWNGTNLICERVPCDASVPLNAHVKSSSPHGSGVQAASLLWKYQDNIVWECDIGFYHSAGDLSQTCMHTGFFNGSNTVCTNIDECHSSPCQNSGFCVDLISGFTCTCVNGYTGVFCQSAPTLSASLQVLVNNSGSASSSQLPGSSTLSNLQQGVLTQILGTAGSAHVIPSLGVLAALLLTII